MSLGRWNYRTESLLHQLLLLGCQAVKFQTPIQGYSYLLANVGVATKTRLGLELLAKCKTNILVVEAGIVNKNNERNLNTKCQFEL